MTDPAIAIRALLAALGMGAGLGIFYGFLRPLRPRLTALADFVFVAAALWAWLIHTFAICGGDSRPVCVLAMAAGGIGWERTLGRLLRPVFALFWRGIGWPLEKIGILFQKIYKYLLARTQK
jgi:hypothetical protein